MVGTTPHRAAGVPRLLRSPEHPGFFHAENCVGALAGYSCVTLAGTCRLCCLVLLIVRLCLEVSLLIFAANFKQNLFYILKSLDKMKLTRVLCLCSPVLWLGRNCRCWKSDEQKPPLSPDISIGGMVRFLELLKQS